MDRGKRTVEILKQGLHKLVSFDKEAVILYALTKGYLDSIDFSDLADFEQTLYREMEISEKGIAISNFIKETKQLPDDSQLDEFIKECKRRYL